MYMLLTFGVNDDKYLDGLLNERLAISLPSTNFANEQYFFGLSVRSFSTHSLTESYFSLNIVLNKSCPNELKSSTILSEFCNSEFSGESICPISEHSDCFVESRISLSMCPEKC